ncbi:MAG: cupredoxin domain-containing protein [Nostocaceae cyanobacterium]|nr:cupredoxin domain-containing protein [Nostocaceae cyanobacterium]
MVIKGKVLGTVIGLGLLLGGALGVQAAEISSPSKQFQRLEQPLSLKIAVTVGGLALMGVELWWFLFSKTSLQQVKVQEGIQEITIAVDGGYKPSRIVVKVGEPVRLNFLRRDPSTCLETVLFPDFHIAQNLANNNVTPVEFTPQKPGEYIFTCGMNMFRGVVEVREK